MSKQDDLNNLAKTVPAKERERFWSLAAAAYRAIADSDEDEIIMSILRSERDQLAATDAADSFTFGRRAVCTGR